MFRNASIEPKQLLLLGSCGVPASGRAGATVGWQMQIRWRD